MGGDLRVCNSDSKTAQKERIERKECKEEGMNVTETQG